MRVITKILGATLLSGFFLTSSAHAIQLTQQKLDLIVSKTSSIELKNDGAQRIAVRIRVVPEKKELSEHLPKGFKSCDKSVKAYPSIFELDPNKYQSVKFLSRELGHCRVYFDTDKLDDKGALATEKDENGMAIHTKFSTGLPVHVTPVIAK